MVDKWLEELYEAYPNAPKVTLTPENQLVLEKVKKYTDFCNDAKEREIIATKAKQAEYQYSIQKIKRQLQYAKLLPESLALPARQDLEEIAAIYQALGTVPQSIQTDDSMQLSLLGLINLYYSNQRFLLERRKILQKTLERIHEEKAVTKKLQSTLHTLKEEKPEVESTIESLKDEIEGVLGPKQKVYEYKEYMAKHKKVEGAYTHDSLQNFSLNMNREVKEVQELKEQYKEYKDFPVEVSAAKKAIDDAKAELKGLKKQFADLTNAELAGDK